MSLTDSYDLSTFISYGGENTYQLVDCSNFIKIGNDLLIVGGCMYDKYIDFIKGFVTYVKLTTNELMKYKYNPKLLSYELYGTEELWYLILKLNNMCSEIEFTKQKIYILRPENLSVLNTINILYDDEISINHNEYAVT